MLGVLALLIITGVAAGFNHVGTRANTLTLHPTTCLGGWENPMHAAGELETGVEPLPDRFSAENSAILPAKTAAEIYCGGFTADIPPATLPRSLVVSLALSAETEAPVLETDNFASSTGEVLDGPADTPIRVVEPDPVPAPAEPVPVPAPEVVPDNEPTSDPEPAAESAPVSRFFAPTAHAQEVEQVVSAGEALAQDGKFLEVRYTFDGSEWHVIDTLDTSHAVSQTFSVPLPEEATWQDLSNFQVALRAVPSVDESPKLYLDGIRIEIEYEAVTASGEITPDMLVVPALPIETLRNEYHYFIFSPTDIPVNGGYCAVAKGSDIVRRLGVLRDYGTCFQNDPGTFEILVLAEKLDGNYQDLKQSPAYIQTIELQVELAGKSGTGEQATTSPETPATTTSDTEPVPLPAVEPAPSTEPAPIP
jgi:hypothetical protein